MNYPLLIRNIFGVVHMSQGNDQGFWDFSPMSYIRDLGREKSREFKRLLFTAKHNVNAYK